MHDRLLNRLRWMETDSAFAHACPDLDQEYPDPEHAEAERVQEYTERMYRAAITQAQTENRIEPMRNPAHWGHDARLWTRERLDDFSFTHGHQWGEQPLAWYLDQLGDA